jgi:hypothetical protein
LNTQLFFLKEIMAYLETPLQYVQSSTRFQVFVVKLFLKGEY